MKPRVVRLEGRGTLLQRLKLGWQIWRAKGRLHLAMHPFWAPNYHDFTLPDASLEKWLKGARKADRHVPLLVLAEPHHVEQTARWFEDQAGDVHRPVFVLPTGPDTADPAMSAGAWNFFSGLPIKTAFLGGRNLWYHSALDWYEDWHRRRAENRIEKRAMHPRFERQLEERPALRRRVERWKERQRKNRTGCIGHAYASLSHAFPKMNVVVMEALCRPGRWRQIPVSAHLRDSDEEGANPNR